VIPYKDQGNVSDGIPKVFEKNIIKPWKKNFQSSMQPFFGNCINDRSETTAISIAVQALPEILCSFAYAETEKHNKTKRVFREIVPNINEQLENGRWAFVPVVASKESTNGVNQQKGCKLLLAWMIFE